MNKETLKSLSPARFAQVQAEKHWTPEQAAKMWKWYFTHRHPDGGLLQKALDVFPDAEVIEDAAG